MVAYVAEDPLALASGGGEIGVTRVPLRLAEGGDGTAGEDSFFFQKGMLDFLLFSEDELEGPGCC